MKLSGLAIVALGSLFFLAMGVGEMAGGDLSGFQHLPQAVLLGALVFLGWRHPYAVGTVLVFIALGIAALYAVAGSVSLGLRFAWAVQIAVPPLAAGALLIGAARRERGRPATPRARPPSPGYL